MVVPYFSNIRQQIIKTLEEATEEIFVAVYWFTNQQLFTILCDKLREGKKVSLIIHNDYINNRDAGLNFQSFIDLGGQFYFSDSEYPMHNKFCVVDNKTLINGSYNWTYYAEDRNSENILVIRDEQETVSAFRQEFLNLTYLLTRVDKVQRLTTFELEEFNGLSSREYLANDIIYEAKATNRPEIIEAAFKISPNNIKVQEAAVKLDLTKKRKLVCSVGAGIKGNKYLVGVEKGTILPVTISKILVTIEDKQPSCVSTLYYGDNDVASLNKKMPNQSTNRQASGVVIYGLPPKPAGEARMKMIFTIDIYGQLKVKFYSLDNGRSDYYGVDIKGLLADVVQQEVKDDTTTE
jgi:hypothetical protein